MSAGALGDNLIESIQEMLTKQNSELRKQMDASIITNSRAVKSVQRLSVMGAGEVTISAVNLNKTIVIINNDSSHFAMAVGQSGFYEVQSLRNYARLISSTKLEYVSESANYNGGVRVFDAVSYVEIIEYV